MGSERPCTDGEYAITLSPERQLRVLARIWGRDREGYVFLPWIAGTARTREARRKAYHEGPAYEWPADEAKILAHLSAHTNDDVYFSVSLFTDKRRVENQAEPERCLWADLDPVDPRGLEHSIRPTIAWESSPGRYQAIWLLDRPLVGASWPGKENQRLTMALGADPSGFDTTQLLRVPGRLNHKPDHREDNEGDPVPGKLLWMDGPYYTADDFDDLPEITLHDASGDDLLDEELLSHVDRHEVWARVRLKVSPRVRELMSIRDPSVAETTDRSDALWQICRDLADAGCSLAEIVAITRASVWNKYEGRNDELRRLKAEAGKAIAAGRDLQPTLEDVAMAKPAPDRLGTLAQQPHPRPAWLVRNIWSETSCGFISGAPKSYKSWTGMDLAVSIASGRRFLGEWMVPTPGPVLYVQEEDSLTTVLSRFEKVLEGRAPDLHWHGRMSVGIGSEAGGVYWEPPAGELPLDVYVRKGFTSSDPAWQGWMAERLSEGSLNADGSRTPYRMVFIDTMGTTAGDVDTDRAAEVMEKILRPLKQMSGAYGVAIALVHHNKKAESGSRAGAQMLGSVALHAWVEDALYVREKQPCVLEGRPGYKVLIERESKSAQDLRFAVEVPQMIEQGDDADRKWRPAVTRWQDDDEVTQERPAAAAKRGTSTSGGARATTPQRAPGGTKIANAVKHSGPRGASVESLVAVLQVSRSSVNQQLQRAMDSGMVEKRDDGRYYAIKAGDA